MLQGAFCPHYIVEETGTQPLGITTLHSNRAWTWRLCLKTFLSGGSLNPTTDPCCWARVCCFSPSYQQTQAGMLIFIYYFIFPRQIWQWWPWKPSFLRDLLSQSSLSAAHSLPVLRRLDWYSSHTAHKPLDPEPSIGWGSYQVAYEHLLKE